MELVFIFAKFLEYTLFMPVWWLATYLAAFIYPVEHDPRQDYLGWIFSFFIIGGLLFSCVYILHDPAQTPLQGAATGATEPAADPDAARLQLELQTLKQAPGISAIMPGEPEKGENH